MILRLLARARNAVDYPLRQAFHWRRSGLRYPNEPKDNLFAGLSGSKGTGRARAQRFLNSIISRSYMRAAQGITTWRTCSISGC
jgi:hypothetical protein